MEILMPQLGETVTEGKITKWFKAAGDAVEPGDNLFEIETDKTSMEVPATSAGVLSEIRVPEGDIAPVGAVVAVVSGDGEAAAPSPTASTPAPAPQKAAAPSPVVPARAETQSLALDSHLRGNERSSFGSASSDYAARANTPLDPFDAIRRPPQNFGPGRLAGGTQVSPLARRLAAQSGIDLGGISPSGSHGRIVAQDVEAAMAKAGKSPPSLLPSQGSAPPARGASAAQVKAQFEAGSYEEVQLDGMRRTIATRLIEAKQTVPHF